MTGVVEEPVRLTRDGAVAITTIDALHMRNALGAPGVREGLNTAISSFEADPGLRVMILYGAGGVFSAGGNLNALRELRDIDQIRARLVTGSKTTGSILTSRKIYLAAVEGPAFGAGMGLALSCDLVIASQTARFCAAQIKVGASPDGSLFWSLPRRTGNAVAKRILLSGDEILMPEALELGIADYDAPSSEALERALVIARKLARGAPLAQSTVKAFFADNMAGRDSILDWERESAAQNFVTKDFLEGANAFLEKRKPQFKGE
jgi:enoyl-CoA hydratase/carnithine racemase